MIPLPPPPPNFEAVSTPFPPGQGDMEPLWADRWAANMVLTIQAVQRLNVAFAAKYVSKSNP
jgi:hypothetical protein